MKLILFLAAFSLYAQDPTGSVVGRVTDPSGGIVPGVKVQVTNLDTNRKSETATNSAGDYTIAYLTPGHYSMQAENAGFRTYRRPDFTIEVDQELRIDIRLEVGAMTESVTVSDTLPALNTESGSRGDVTTNAEITEMPLNGRNFSDLVYLTSGVAPKGEDADGAYALNGARADNVSFLVDGMNNTQRRNTTSMVSPPIEGIQEFKIITSGFNAEYGRFAGGVLSVVSKTGGNRLRGSLYEFMRNDLPDARNFFDQSKSKLRQNQFGATLTGPVVLPKLYNGHDKTFFLFTWESLRQIAGSTQRGIVPTAAQLRGDFSQARDALGNPLKVTDPLAKNAPFPGNQIPVNRFDPVSVKLATFYPAPDLAGSGNNYIAQGNNTASNNNFGAKVDHTLTPSDRLMLSAFWKPGTSYSPFQRSPIPIFGATNQQFGVLAGLRWVHIVTPSLINEFTANFSRQTLNQGWPGNSRDWAAETGFVGGTKNPTDLGLPYVDVSGYVGLGQAYDLPKIWTYNNYQLANAMTWNRGRHNLKFGGDALHYQYYNKGYGDLRGRMTFLGRFTAEPMADFLLGYVQSSRRLLDVSREYLQVRNYSAFVQDDFKVAPTFTLNLGLRYELMMQPTEKYGARSAFNPGLGKVVVAGTGGLANFNDLIQATGLANYVVMASDVGLPASVVRTNYKNFAPRLGFAWRPLGTRRTVIRGGYGIFYGSDSVYRYDELSAVYPFSLLQTFSATSSNPLLLTVSNPFPASKTKISGINSTSGAFSDTPTQYLQSWNTTIEREVGAGVVLEVAYAGSKGTHLPRRWDINQQFANPALKQADGTYPRPFPAFSTINVFGNVANSIYNSGTVTVRRQVSRRFFIRAAYVYAKSIDDSSNTGGTIADGFAGAQDSRNLHGERGRSDFDIGHSFLASYIWQPRLGKNLLLRNWELAGTSRAYTGSPFTPKLANFDITTGGAARPDRIAKGNVDNPSPDRWFDITAFPVVPVGSYRFGTSGRNVLDGPGTFNIDTSLSRRFFFSERRAMQFRLESFNLLNHTNFNLPENQVDVLNSATISQAKTQRVFQFALRLEF